MHKYGINASKYELYETISRDVQFLNSCYTDSNVHTYKVSFHTTYLLRKRHILDSDTVMQFKEYESLSNSSHACFKKLCKFKVPCRLQNYIEKKRNNYRK